MRSKPIVIFLSFTHCSEVCPTTLYELAVWFNALGDDGKEINLYFIKIDPERDNQLQEKFLLHMLCNIVTYVFQTIQRRS